MTPAPDLRFASGYADWGKCELCGVEVPPTGARIGFFGKADVSPSGAGLAWSNQGTRSCWKIWDHRRLALKSG